MLRPIRKAGDRRRPGSGRGAGTGRIALPVAEMGVEVVAVEPSAAMLAVLEEKVADRPAFAVRNNRNQGAGQPCELDREVPPAITSGSFDHPLDCEGHLAALRNVARHVEPDGTLVLDILVGLMGTRRDCRPIG